MVNFAYNFSAGDDCSLTIVSSDAQESTFRNETTGVTQTFAGKAPSSDAIGKAFYIFAPARSDKTKDNAAAYRLYSIKLSNGTTPVRDLRPARRLTDGELGLYDTLGGAFYTNAGSGRFRTADSTGHRLTYIRPSGTYPAPSNAQKINDFWTTTSNFTFEFWFGDHEDLKSGNDNIPCAYVGEGTWNTGSFLLNSNGGGNMNFFGASSSATLAGAGQVGAGTYCFRLNNVDGSTRFEKNGEVLSRTTANANLKSPSGKPLAIFGLRNGATGTSNGYVKGLSAYAIYSFYGIKIADTVCHEFVPYMTVDGDVAVADAANNFQFFPATAPLAEHGLAYDLVNGTAQFPYGTFTTKDLQALDSGAVAYTKLEKTTMGILTTAAIGAFNKSVLISAGTWDLVDGAAKRQSIPSLTLAGGTTLAFDLVGATSDQIAADIFTLTATSNNTVKIALSNSNVDWTNGFTLLTGGLRAGDDVKFELVDSLGMDLSLVIENGALRVVCADPPPTVAKWQPLGTGTFGWVGYDGQGNVVDSAPSELVTELVIPAGTIDFTNFGTLPPHRGGLRFEATNGAFELASDVDFGSLDLSQANPGQTFDLKGHHLTLKGKDGTFETALTFTDSSATGSGGTLTIDVPAGAVLNNTGLTFTGSLLFEKTGAGSFKMSKSPQSYTGGTRVSGGLLDSIARSGEDDLSHAPHEQGFVPFGPVASVIEIATGGTFDIGGNYCYCKHQIILAGGTLKNSVTQGNVHNTWYSIGNLTLTADSTLVSEKGTHLGASRSSGEMFAANLGGHTLDIQITAGDFTNDPFHLICYAFTNGTLRVSKGGWFHVWNEGPAWTDCTFDFASGALQFDANFTVSNLIQRAETDNTSGWNKRQTGRLFMTGTYTPVADYYHNFTIKSGATIDLTAHTLPFTVAPAYALRDGDGKSTFEFEADGKFFLRLASVPALGTKVIDWSAQPPANPDRLRFIDPTRRCGFCSTAEGVEVRAGMAIVIP